MTYQKPEITVYEADELLRIEANAGSSSCATGSCATGGGCGITCGVNLNV